MTSSPPFRSSTQQCKSENRCPTSAHLHFCRFVVAAILVLVRRPVAVTEETLEAIFAPQLAHDLVQSLSVEGIVVHGKGRIADGWE